MKGEQHRGMVLRQTKSIRENIGLPPEHVADCLLNLKIKRFALIIK
jgi:hypothetical protein